jgi:hypothetical protein
MKQNKSLMVFFSCAIGAVIGYLLAKRFGIHLWYLGTLAGGILGYLLYDIKQIVEAIPRAWKYAREKSKFKIDWKAVGFVMKVFGWIALILLIVIGIPVIYEKFAVKSLAMYGIEVKNGMFLDFTKDALIFMAAYLNVLIAMEFHIRKDKSRDSKDQKVFYMQTGIWNILRFSKKNWFTFLLTTFLCFPLAVLLIVRSALLLLIWGISVLPKYGKLAIKFCGNFLWMLFKLIHSDLRLLVGIDSVIGGTVGYFCNSILIGMLVGGLWGLINYKLVSIWWLKLKPRH